MNILEAFAALARIPRGERIDLLSGQFWFESESGEAADCWPAAATASVVLSGWLPSLDSEDELRAAVRQGARLLDAGIVAPEQLEAETLEVARAVMEFGAEHEQERAAYSRGGV